MKFTANRGTPKKAKRVFTLLFKSGWHTSPAVTSFFIKRFFFHPQPYALSNDEEVLLRNARIFWFTVHDKRIKAFVWGEGPGVLFVHGWNGRGIQFHRFIPPVLERGFSAVALDGPAHGESEGRHTSYFEFSDTVRIFMKSQHGLHIRRIIAHSLGASAAVNGQSKDGYPAKMVLLAPALRIGAMLQQTLLRCGVPTHVFEAMIEEYEKQYGYSLVEDDPIRLLKDIQSDILIIHDQSDRASPYKDVKDAAAANPRIELLTTKGLGHIRILTEKRIVNAAIDFLT